MGRELDGKLGRKLRVVKAIKAFKTSKAYRI